MTILTLLWMDNLMISFPEFHVSLLNSRVQIHWLFTKWICDVSITTMCDSHGRSAMTFQGRTAVEAR